MVKPSSSKLKRFIFWLRTHKLASIALVLVLLVVGFFVYEKVALEFNKRAFAQARTAIDAVYADIVKDVGQPDDYDRSSSCSIYEGLFGDEGPISCNIDTSFIFGVNNQEGAEVQFKKIQEAVKQHKKFKLSKPLSLTITSQGVVNSVYHTASDEFLVSGLPCIINYVYDTPREIFLKVKDQTKKPLQIVIGCHGIARNYFYSKSQ